MDLVVMIDGTISIGYEPFAEQRDFVLSILSKMKFGLQATQLCIIQFSDKFYTAVEMEMGEHGGRAEVLRNVSNIKYQQGRRTMTGLAMVLANEQLFGKIKARPEVDRVILLITDGKPADMNLLQNVVKELKEKHVKIISVAIGTSYNYIQRFRYIVRSIASGFKQAFKVEKDNMKSIEEDVAKEVCRTVQPPAPPKGKPKLQQKCFQEKKDILFALDGSRTVNTYTFNKAKSFVAQICAELDITPTLIHVGMLQYSDALNTRIEFGLDQYTKYHQINESLQNVFHSKGSRADLETALSIIGKQIFNGQNGDRISAEDFVLLFVNDGLKQGDQVLEQTRKLKDKGVHVIIIGLGKPADLYEKMASHPSDVNYLDTVLLKHIVGDLTAITCRKVKCEDNEVEKNQKDKRDSEKESLCQQRSQDVLLMIDTTSGMKPYFNKALKFFTKFVKRLNIAATKTDVGLMTFGRNRKHLNMEFGKYKFENDISKKILKTTQTDKWSSHVDVAGALHMVNKQIFNTSTGGHRKGSPDLIFIATRGKVLDRYKIQKQSKMLRAKGVRIAVLDVGFKTPAIDYLNAIHDMVSGAKDIYPMDFRKASTISQALLDVKCKVEEKTVSPQCFSRSRKVFFMLDRSQNLTYSELPKVITFIKDIVKRLYTDPNNIEVGLMHYSDIRTARYPLMLRKWSLKVALDRIEYLRYRSGRKNFLGYALKTVRKV
ncbi:Hypothetical predicted protein [Paramuricea clavata]|uniref:Uncharacterized protein n=1 Tax=Paramuricea clavata TaxID=317549 RepID=A0A6S7IX72_PARCT|nr:Hypothetical predicted protein [Paramuricea clavata]